MDFGTLLFFIISIAADLVLGLLAFFQGGLPMASGICILVGAGLLVIMKLISALEALNNVFGHILFIAGMLLMGIPLLINHIDLYQRFPDHSGGLLNSNFIHYRMWMLPMCLLQLAAFYFGVGFANIQWIGSVASWVPTLIIILFFIGIYPAKDQQTAINQLIAGYWVSGISFGSLVIVNLIPGVAFTAFDQA